MIKVVYLVMFMLGGDGVTSQSIPQANMQQCQANQRIFNTGKSNKDIVTNSRGGGARGQYAFCLLGVK